MKTVDNDINFAEEKTNSSLDYSLLSIFKYFQSKFNFNDPTNNRIYPERIYKQPYNKRKNKIMRSEVKLIW